MIDKLSTFGSRKNLFYQNWTVVFNWYFKNYFETTVKTSNGPVRPWPSTGTLCLHCRAYLRNSSMNVESKNKGNIIVLICFTLFLLGSAQQIKYLKVSKQTGPLLDKATSYATLSGQSVTSQNFTLCGSIKINFFRGYQAFYTLRRNDKVNL